MQEAADPVEFVVRLGAEEAEQLAGISRSQGRSADALIRDAIRDLIAKRRNAASSVLEAPPGARFLTITKVKAPPEPSREAHVRYPSAEEVSAAIASTPGMPKAPGGRGTG